MAFTTPTPEQAAEMVPILQKHARQVAEAHRRDVVAPLRKRMQSGVITDLAADFARAWRSSTETRVRDQRTAALLLIAAGERPDVVCGDLRVGRTALENAVRKPESKLRYYRRFLASDPEVSRD